MLHLKLWNAVADPRKTIRGGALNLRFSPFVGGGGGCGRDTSRKGAPDTVGKLLISALRIWNLIFNKGGGPRMGAPLYRSATVDLLSRQGGSELLKSFYRIKIGQF